LKPVPSTNSHEEERLNVKYFPIGCIHIDISARASKFELQNWHRGHEFGRGEFRVSGSVKRMQGSEVSDLPSYLSDKPAMIAAFIIR
jgi:hypothetical protein